MSTFTGKDGQVFADGVMLADIIAWRFVTTADNVSYASSATGGFRRRLPGVRHGMGQVQFILRTPGAASVSLQAGDRVTLQLNLDSMRFFQVPAIIDTVHFAIDINSREPARGTAEFSNDGAWIEPVFA